jgi:hypothetical protein
MEKDDLVAERLSDVAAGRVAIRQDEPRSVLVKELRLCRALTARGARDDTNLALKHSHAPLPCSGSFLPLPFRSDLNQSG